MVLDGSTALRDAGLRVTRPRLAVLNAVAQHPHSVTTTILDAARESLPSVSHQAVYDCLAVLADAGVLRRIQPTGSVARYEIATGDNHHQLVCRLCGTIRDVACAAGRAPCLEAPDDHGFRIDEAEVNYWGICPECVTRQRSRHTPSTLSPLTSPTSPTP